MHSAPYIAERALNFIKLYGHLSIYIIYHAVSLIKRLQLVQIDESFDLRQRKGPADP